MRWSYNRLVEATGLSKTRVAQLVGEARARGIHQATTLGPKPATSTSTPATVSVATATLQP
jgi:hypothetical protein